MTTAALSLCPIAVRTTAAFAVTSGLLPGCKKRAASGRSTTPAPEAGRPRRGALIEQSCFIHATTTQDALSITPNLVSVTRHLVGSCIVRTRDFRANIDKPP